MDTCSPTQPAQRQVRVLENALIARDTYRIRLEDPVMSRAILPGQFLMIRPAQGSDPLLGRPFALYDTVRDSGGSPVALDVVYIVIGPGTQAMASLKPGDHVQTWGPLGNGFGSPPPGRVLMVAGGIGQTPFLSLAKWWLGKAPYGTEPSSPSPRALSAELLYGVRTASLLAGVSDFHDAGIPIAIATDDGTAGHHGFITDLLERRLAVPDNHQQPDLVVACGPHGLLSAVARITKQFQVPCQLSLENHMACGFGACFSCVTPIRLEDGTVDLKRVCVEGPIFDARRVVI